jgi:hypothetical protein
MAEHVRGRGPEGPPGLQLLYQHRLTEGSLQERLRSSGRATAVVPAARRSDEVEGVGYVYVACPCSGAAGMIRGIADRVRAKQSLGNCPRQAFEASELTEVVQAVVGAVSGERGTGSGPSIPVQEFTVGTVGEMLLDAMGAGEVVLAHPITSPSRQDIMRGARGDGNRSERLGGGREMVATRTAAQAANAAKLAPREGVSF